MLNFWKYSATGNDFIVFDVRDGKIPDLDWEALCHRKTGLGADGILLLGESGRADFKMTYLNADGGEVEMCGNGDFLAKTAGGGSGFYIFVKLFLIFFLTLPFTVGSHAVFVGGGIDCFVA